MVDNKVPEIYCEALKKARIAKKIEISDLANTLCLSTKHISQIEEGGDSAFFSKSHKVQVAKKVGAYLGLSDSQIVDTSGQVVSDVEVEQLGERPETGESDLINKLDKLGNANLETKSNKTKGIMIALSLLALAVIAYWIFGKGSTQENGLQQANSGQEIVKSEVDISEPRPIASEAPLSPCDIEPQNVAAFKVTKANSAGNFIYMVSKADQTICVIDAKNNKRLVKLSDQEKKNLIGIPPFTILSPDFKKVDIYYQGWKVPVPANANTIRTEEQSIKSENFLMNDSSNTDQK